MSSEKYELDRLHPTKGDDDTARDDVPKGRMTLTLFMAMCCAAFGSSFQFGYNIGVINQPKQVVQSWINESHTAMFDTSLSKSEGDVVWSVVVSIYAIGGMVGGLVSGIIAERFGRKGGMLLNNVFAFLAAALLGLSKLSGVYHILILGRLVVGFNAGLNTGLAPLYLTEISPVNLRGALGTVHQLVVTISIWISMLIGLPSILGNADWWPILFALTAVPAVYQLIFFVFSPESPKHMLINKNLRDRAEQALIKLRGTTDVKREMEIMEDETARMRAVSKLRFTDMFRDKTLYWPLTIAVVMMLSQQLSGINVAMYYSTTVFKGAGLGDTEARWATIGMGAINVLMTMVSTVTVDRFGRRALHLIGMIGMFLTSIGLCICLSFSPKTEKTLNVVGNVTEILIKETGHPAAAYGAIVLVFLFVISFATGPGSIPWFYVSELFLQNARAHANSVAVVFNWLANFIVGLIFLPLNNAIGPFSFLVFSACLLVFIVFTWLYVPETKGRTVDDIVDDFRKGKYRQ